jgi:hypothetical protein
MSIFNSPAMAGLGGNATVAGASTQIAAPAADLLTVAQVAGAVPPNLKSSITQAFVDNVNQIVTDPLIAEQVRNNFIGFTGVMKEGKFKLEDYLNAVLYVSYKAMGYSNKESYFRTFPQRHAHLVAKGTSEKDISAYVSAYNKGKLVNLILEQTLVPSWVLNQSIYQAAINHQYTLMTTAVSEKVQQEAANSLLTHLKKPEGKDFQINMNMQETSGINELKEALRDVAQMQRDAIAAGTNIKNITDSVMIDAEATDVTND